MDKILIKGGVALHGTIPISGAKNAALPLMTACLLTDETLTLSNLPHLADISTMANLLIQHGVDFTINGNVEGIEGGAAGRVVLLNANNITSYTAPYDIVRKMRASVWVLGPLLARFGDAKVSLPGGCAIGTRPIDLHLYAFEKLGATINLEEGYIHASCKGRLKGAEINFDKVSVGATANAMMAATLAEGTTTIRNAACEPEVSDLAHCLVAMGAEIEGIDTTTLTIHGKEKLHGAHYSIIPDRIEAGTYAIAAGITGGCIELTGIRTDIMGSTIEKLEEAGITITPTEKGFKAERTADKINPVNIQTDPYPLFPTDMQAQFMALMTLADGSSDVTETIFENRFMHVPELVRMGANIMIHDHNTATVKGAKKLIGAEVMATDLRASVSLVLAGLAAEGQTIVNRVYHIDRGYERIEEKLALCGAHIARVSE